MTPANVGQSKREGRHLEEMTPGQSVMKSIQTDIPTLQPLNLSHPLDTTSPLSSLPHHCAAMPTPEPLAWATSSPPLPMMIVGLTFQNYSLHCLLAGHPHNSVLSRSCSFSHPSC